MKDFFFFKYEKPFLTSGPLRMLPLPPVTLAACFLGLNLNATFSGRTCLRPLCTWQRIRLVLGSWPGTNSTLSRVHGEEFYEGMIFRGVSAE